MNSYIWTLGLICVLVGAALIAGPSFGFATLATERATSITTADDASAYVSAEPEPTAVNLSYGDGPVVVGEFGNNLPGPLTVDSMAVTGPGAGLVTISDPVVGDTVGTGDTTSVALRCAGDGDALDSPLTIVSDFSAPTASVEGASFTKSVDIECQHPVVGIDGGLDSAGRSGQVRFQVETQDDLEILITDFAVTTKNDLQDITFTDQGSTIPTTVNGPSDVTLNRFDDGLTLNDYNFVDPDGPAADIVVTFDLDQYGTVSLGIDASEFTPGPPGP